MKTMRVAFFLVMILALSFAGAHAQTSAPKNSYENWLEKYNAYDRLEKEITSAAQQDTPEAILKRAKVYLQLGKPHKTLEIVEMTPSLEDNASEAMRLWYGGQAHRAIGDLPKSVLWFTQASSHMQDKRKLRSLFRKEANLDSIWKDVWRHMYWTYVSNYTMSRRTQLGILKQTMETAQSVWSDSFWEKAGAIYLFESTGNATLLPAVKKEKVRLDKNGNPLPSFISDEDRNAMARSLAAASLEDFQKARLEMQPVRVEAVKEFWSSLITFIETGDHPDDLGIYNKNNYLKARAFWSGNILAPFEADRQEWLLGDSGAGAWRQFRNKALAMPVEQAQAAIDKELGSLLISERTVNLLQSFKLAFTLMNNDMVSAATIWEQMDKRALPVSLQVAGLIAFGGSLDSVMPSSAGRAFKLYPVLSELSGAAGKDIRPTIEAPFWAKISSGQLRSAAKSKWPMDRLVLLAYWQKELNRKPQEPLAKRAAFMFSDTSFGINSLFYLADQAIMRKDMAMSQFYLNRLSPEDLGSVDKSRWYEVKTRMELAFGKQEKALDTYKELVSVGEPVPSFTRLRMALLMQQRGELTKARDQLLQLWGEKDTLTPAMQAEILFWLGEGEQAMRNTDAALDYYLRLAWQYPAENIWALTAMYRASLIYEKRGIYQTAKKLLSTVIKNADTKEQREAAKARLSAINAKTGKKKKSSDSEIVYPY